jgi:hypothetical protein
MRSLILRSLPLITLNEYHFLSSDIGLYQFIRQT